MIEKHDVAEAEISNGKVSLRQGVCHTHFTTNAGIQGKLYIQRWVRGEQVLRYLVSINLTNPLTNIQCGGIGLPTQDIRRIRPWITAAADRCNEQLKLRDTSILDKALEDLTRQFGEFMPTLLSEEEKIQEAFPAIARPE